MKRLFALLALMSLAAVIVAGCNQSPDQSTPPPAKESTNAPAVPPAPAVPSTNK